MNEFDRISGLPGHIIDQILAYLSIKEAVRTSILSRKWRYKWSSVPELVFDDQCMTAVGPMALPLFQSSRLVNMINKILLLHTGPIQKFKLSHKGYSPTSDIDHWILHLSRLSVKQITLHIWKGQYYKIPISLFNLQDLIHLELLRCSMKIPSTLEGFKNLESLDLQFVELSQHGLEALISRCPLLKRLLLKNLERIIRVNIKARNLEWLSLEGCFEDVTFDVMNHLTSVRVSFYGDIADKCGYNNTNLSNLHKFVQNLPKVQSLELEEYSLKYLAVGNVSWTLPNELVHLKYLSTCINFSSVEEVWTVMYLIRNSPQLKHIDFQSRAKNQQTTGITTVTDFWEDHQACCLEQVQVISMGRISSNKPEKEIVKFLLANSPKLQKMTIRPNSTSGECKLCRELLRFRRASTQAEVILLDHVDP